MKIWKVSLGRTYITDTEFNSLVSRNLISVHPETPPKGQQNQKQGELFTDAKKGDLFYVCRSNDSIEFIGMFCDNRPLYSTISRHSDWADREYILIENATNKNSYNKSFDKWWSPKNNSTFIEIPSKEFNLFEKEILKPVFEKELNEILRKRQSEYVKIKPKLSDFCKLQKEFTNMLVDEYILEQVNSLSKIELKKIHYEYMQRKEISKQPVVLLRKSIVEKLLLGTTIDKSEISKLKNDISQNFEKNVFKSWTSYFRILYQLVFSQYKENTETYFNKFMGNIRERLDIKEITKTKLVHFDGAQNQGSNEIWFAIYNKTHSSQKYAYQLFFIIKDGIHFGLHHMDKRIQSNIVSNNEISYKELMNFYSSLKNKIIEDNSKEKAMITNLVDILKDQKQIILQGPPGTGKTRLSKQISRFMINGEKEPIISDLENKVKLIQFHPSYSYEDFVRGIIAKTNNNNQVEYKVENKTLIQFAEQAIKDKDQPYILIIDEINRADLSSVLGELIYALEYRDEPVESMYEKDGSRKIVLPSNLYIIGTMNTADRSIGHIDYAIRRRFVFCDVHSNKEVLNDYPKGKILYEIIETLFNEKYVSPEFEVNDIIIGHSYFISNTDENTDELSKKFIYQVLPLLKEYFKDGIFHTKPEIKLGNKKFDLSNKVSLTTEDIKEFLK